MSQFTLFRGFPPRGAKEQPLKREFRDLGSGLQEGRLGLGGFKGLVNILENDAGVESGVHRSVDSLLRVVIDQRSGLSVVRVQSGDGWKRFECEGRVGVGGRDWGGRVKLRRTVGGGIGV